jgi:hypothetical protein
MLKKLWWWVKVGIFPHLERRTKPRPKKMGHADDMLAIAIMDLTNALEGKKK